MGIKEFDIFLFVCWVFFSGFKVLVEAAGTDLYHRASAEDSVSFRSSLAGIHPDYI